MFFTKWGEDMTCILVDDEQRCNFCVFWTGMRQKAEDFVYIDIDSAEGGICLHPQAVMYGKPMLSCNGCALCTNAKSILYAYRIIKTRSTNVPRVF